MSIEVYIVFIQEIWVQIYGYFLGARSVPFGCMSMARLGAKYAVVGCKVYGYFWVHVYTFLGACLWLGWVHVCGCWVHA